MGEKQVIKGWDEGVVGLKVGTKGILTCPPNQAYGSQSVGKVIPANATLIFEIEICGLEKPPLIDSHITYAPIYGR